jgi:tripeptide aminopeptidase
MVDTHGILAVAYARWNIVSKYKVDELKNSIVCPPRLLESFTRLVRIDGVAGSEREVASEVQARLASIGVTSHIDAAGETFGGNCGNVLARVPGNAIAPPILLCAHMDTVLPTAGLKIVRDAEAIASDGTTILGADDRAGIAIILEILQVLVEGTAAHGPVQVLFTVAEESGMRGVKAVDAAALDASMGFVFDSSAACGGLVIEAPAAVAFTAWVRGLAAHAAVAPEQGVHAIQIASRAIARLPLGRHGRTGMLNVGTIRGGTAINVVPSEVEVVGETRSADPMALERQMDLVTEAFEQAAREFGGQVEIAWSRKYGGFELEPSAPAVLAAMRGIRAAGCVPEPIHYPAGSDANVLNERGIPTVNLGIGTRHVHSMRESMPIRSLIQGAEIGLRIVTELAEGAAAVIHQEGGDDV